MKKAPFLLLAVPIVAGAIYLRSLASWRPHKVFGAKGEIKHLVFSNDGKTLLVGLGAPSSRNLTKVTALDATRGFATKWTYDDGSQVSKPQFYLSDARVLVGGDFVRTLDTNTGKMLSKERYGNSAAMSADGTWLAYTKGYILLESFPRFSPPHKNEKKLYIRDRSISSNYFFAPDGKTFVVDTIAFEGNGMRSRLDFYDVKTWKRTRFWWTHAVKGALYDSPSHLSDNGQFLLCVSDTYLDTRKSYSAKVDLWRVSDGHKLSSQTFEGPHPPSSTGGPETLTKLEVQNDGRVLKFSANAPVSLSKTPNLNDDFKQLLSLPSETITAATMSPDGSYLVAGTQSGHVIWKRVK